MNTLRLENINLHSSYMVGQTEENPFSFYFDTDFGLRYTISLRNRLFIHWFNIYEHWDRYIIRTAEGMLDGVQNFTALFSRKDNPRLDELLSEFEETIAIVFD